MFSDVVNEWVQGRICRKPLLSPPELWVFSVGFPFNNSGIKVLSLSGTCVIRGCVPKKSSAQWGGFGPTGCDSVGHITILRGQVNHDHPLGPELWDIPKLGRSHQFGSWNLREIWSLPWIGDSVDQPGRGWHGPRTYLLGAKDQTGSELHIRDDFRECH